MKALITLIISLFALQGAAQELVGRVWDEKVEPYAHATVWLYNGSILQSQAETDYDGLYKMSVLPGIYNIKVWADGYDTMLLTDVIIDPAYNPYQQFHLSKAEGLAKLIVRVYCKPVKLTATEVIGIIPYEAMYECFDFIESYTPNRHVFSRADLSVMSYTNTNDIIATLPGAYQRRRGDEVRMHGSGPGGFTYIVDGIVE